MFHKALELKYLDGTALEVRFQDGMVKRFDLASLFEKYPQLRALEDRELFLNGKLMGPYGIIWNDELDLEVETVYEEGETVRSGKPQANMIAAQAVSAARAKSGLSQKQLAELTGIDQSDLSKIERGVSNPSVSTMERIASALGGSLSISIQFPAAS
ncbi:MAG: helix-turn-helix domain-containing protein [Lachnospiraceae bacterium]|nr:helix-turn-helix domain-containing protein [Lachnospiraceae bacterium]